MSTEIFSLAGKRVWVAGHRGMVGSALVRRLQSESCEILTAGRGDLDLVDQGAVNAWMAREKPDAVFLAAAKVGGIVANNTRRAEFIYENLAIATNLIHAAHVTGVAKLMFLGSTCIYPRMAPQPLNEDALLTGPLEITNEPYAIAKIAGIKMCEAYRAQYGSDFISVMPTNLYGPGDNYHPEHAHVVAALILAGFLNIGTGEDIAIAEFARLVAKVVGYQGRISYDTSRPDGTPRKLVDVGRMRALGWTASTGLEQGLAKAYQAFLAGAKAER